MATSARATSMKKGLLTAALLIAAFGAVNAAVHRRQPADLRFEVRIAPGLIPSPRDGRLFVVLGRNRFPEPRTQIGRTGYDVPPVFAKDLKNFAPGIAGIIDDTAASFPIENLAELPKGDYFAQAIFDSNIDLKSINAPGNLYSSITPISVDTFTGDIRIELTRMVPEEESPSKNEYIKYIKIRSELLSKFHARPIYLRAGIILPRGYTAEPSRKYPLRVHIGGYGARYTNVSRMMLGNSEFRTAWLSDDAPRMILLHLDGDGPFGDPYQVNSENNGPYGDAVTRELIPYVEQKFRAIGQPSFRVLDGGSTGGWVALALQIFYPDFFGGTWSYCPDSVDFRALQLINIYRDVNAYVNEHGFERPSARDLNGDVRFTIRHECQMENVMGFGDSWTMSGEQWGAWNAVYGARGLDGRPMPLWDAKSGKIDRRQVEHWKKYDLRMVLEENWKTLGPKLRGKINIWIGEADDYFLNNAVHMLDQFLSKANPPYEGRIVYGPGKGHCFLGLTQRQLMDEMARQKKR